MENETKIDFNKIKNKTKKVFSFLKQKKILNIILISLLILVIVGGVIIRTQNLTLLKDSTTGESIPLALDPFYFIRVAETIIDNGGSLPMFDSMRYPAADIGFTEEILPQAIAGMYKFANIFGDYSLQYIGILSPVIFFVLGIIVFFFLIYSLTKSKATALISTIFLAVIPTYLYRTMSGFADHESLGMFAFFLVLLGYCVSLKFLNKDKNEKEKNTSLKSILFGLLTGFLTVLTIASWGGIAKFVFLIIPLSFFIFWIFKIRNKENKNKAKNFLLFYGAWIISTILISIFLGFGLFGILYKYMLSTHGLISLFVLVFIIADYIFLNLLNKNILSEKHQKHRILYSLGITLVLGVLFLLASGRSISELISKVFENLIRPFGESRVGKTVAENKPPYLNDWINQIGKIFFWLFFGGLIAIGIRFSKGIKNNKRRILMILFWIIMVSGIIFSRISSNSVLNGNNFISYFIHIGSIILFFSYLAFLYFKEKQVEFSPEWILVICWTIFMLIAVRGATRFFFFITPFACFSAGLIISDVFKYARGKRDELLKMVFGILIVLILIGALFSFNNFIVSSYNQAKNLSPSANTQWQKAMQWIREETPENSIFLHWWDYGYWVQSLGKRRTVSDGGHAEGSFQDHLIGRYVLTTPQPETALSYMKSHNVSHLLIDSTDIGKYGAYSKIGSGPEGKDRYSSIPVMLADSEQTQETSNGTVKVYQGGVYVDEDIVYGNGDDTIFIPENKGVLIGVINEIDNDGSISQPRAVFMYNGEQIYIPVRYAYFNEKLYDFGGGLDAVVYVFPRFVLNNNNLQTDYSGAVMYLSPKISESLFAQLYLMNDPLDKYPTLELTHAESDSLVNSIKSQYNNVPEFVYYKGIRGPIKIWKVSYPNNIIAHEELTDQAVKGWGSLDNLQFSK